MNKLLYTDFIYVLLVITTIIHSKASSTEAQFLITNQIPQRAVTIRKQNSGRLGNQIIPYIKAKWISQELSIPYLHTPFTDEHLFVLYDHELAMPDDVFNSFERVIEVHEIEQIENDLHDFPNTPTLYVINLLTKLQPKFHRKVEYSQEFIAYMRQMLKSRLQEGIILNSYDDTETVALHIRTGGSAIHVYDPETDTTETKDVSEIGNHKVLYNYDSYYKDRFPTKFLPIEYYACQLNQLAILYPKQRLHVYIFTDDSNPLEIKKQLEALTQSNFFTFECRPNNRHDKHVVEDLELMSQCKYLIRSESTLAIIAEFLGKHTCVISPIITTYNNNPTLIMQNPTIPYSKPPIDAAIITMHHPDKPLCLASKYL